ncbi:MAG: MlaD family protein [Deltaproteobacteria bacterium]|jgi:phospholipid/cholesterol/gamma-HCH transport system substrate-binding protein|nr:MlaD family protein [Deltaproteobacteria bacterium]
METKASHVLVGIAVILAVAAFFGLILFSLNKGDSGDTAYYHIEFKGGVSGLSVGNDVRFNGIRVGKVQHLEIDDENPSIVRVIVSMPANVPVREDSEASLEAQGLTGLSVVYITGGSSASPKLLPGENGAAPVIKSRRSTLSNILDKVPDVVDSTNALLLQVLGMLSGENGERLSAAISSLAAMSAAMERRSLELEATIRELTAAGARMQAVLANADKMLTQEVSPAIGSFQRSFQRLYELLDRVEPGLSRLSTDTAEDLRRFLNEANLLLHNLNTLVRSINSNPRRFIFGDSVPSFEMK